MAGLERSAKKMNLLIDRLVFGVASLAIAAGFASCMSGKARIGAIQSNASKTFLISATVPAKDYPSRRLFFAPRSHDGYSELIYQASISSVLTNTGNKPFRVSAHWANISEESVAPGNSISLPKQPVKDYCMAVGPSPGHDAAIDFKFSFDRIVTTDSSWDLIAAWSDGP
ncbi:hypothetical protein OAF27_03220 [Verrucomicrobiales bacterium]|nr:hypothetical protein [Verrucomicrobiales bacterium]